MTHNKYDVSFTLTLGPEKITNIAKFENALTDILWSLDVGAQIDKAIEGSVGFMVHERNRLTHMERSTSPVKVVPRRKLKPQCV